jgi:Flp pilus assembly protein TadG
MPHFHPDAGPEAFTVRRCSLGRRCLLGWRLLVTDRRVHPTSPTRTCVRKPLLGDERGSAVVEFVFLGVLLLVPVVYLVLTVGQLQGGSFAVVGASDQAAKVYVDSPTPQEADARAREAARIALADFGFTEDQAVVNIACSGQCLAPASDVTVVVTLKVPLPLIPAVSGSYPSAATVDSSSTQIVERFG